MSVAAGVRRTALLLHTLQPEDRASLLGQFDAEEQRVLRGLLEELLELGIPHDKALLDETMAGLSGDKLLSADRSKTSAAQSGTAAHPDAIVAWLDGFPAQQIVAVLKDESPELIGRILACHSWSWGAALVEQFEPLKRRQIKSLSHSVGQQAPRLTAVLLASFAERLRELPDVAAQVTPRQDSRTDRLLLLLRRTGMAGSLPVKVRKT